MRRAILGLVLVAVTGLLAACAPPPTATGDLSGFVQVCTTDRPLASASLTIVDAPPGADMYWTGAAYYPSTGEWVGVTQPLNDVEVGQTYAIWGTALDRGRCLNVFSPAGIVYRITLTKVSDPSWVLVWYNNLDGGPLQGWMPCGNVDDGAAPDGCTIVT